MCLDVSSTRFPKRTSNPWTWEDPLNIICSGMKTFTVICLIQLYWDSIILFIQYPNSCNYVCILRNVMRLARLNVETYSTAPQSSTFFQMRKADKCYRFLFSFTFNPKAQYSKNDKDEISTDMFWTEYSKLFYIAMCSYFTDLLVCFRCTPKP